MRYCFPASSLQIQAIMLAVSLLVCVHPSFAEELDKVILPSPPQQTATWSPSALTEASDLPAPLIAATATLFAQGMADPRGGEYRSIHVIVGNVWQSRGTTIETHGWVLPGDPNGKQFAVCWNGLVYPVVAVKDRVDLEKDIDAFLQNQQTKDTKKRGRIQAGWVDGGRASTEADSISVLYPSLLKCAFLLRIGETELARRVYAEWNDGGVQRGNNSREDHRDPYLLLATQWAWATYDRAVCAHIRGDDPLSLADSENLVRWEPLIDQEAERRKYPSYADGSIHESGKPYLKFTDNLQKLREDAKRRLAGPTQQSVSLDAIKKLPQPERIAGLIQKLDEVNTTQDWQPGRVRLASDPICTALSHEGDAAVEPLLDVIEKDQRLVRSVSFRRDFFMQRNLLSVHSAALAVFFDITKASHLSNKPPTVEMLRAWWAANKTLSSSERWLAQLAMEEVPDTPNADRWQEAAEQIVQRSNVEIHGGVTTTSRIEPGKPLPPFRGESLRGRQNPSVSDLLQKRALYFTELTRKQPDFDFIRGARFALMLYEWDPKSPQTLSTLQDVMRRCRDFQEQKRKRRFK